MNSFASYNLELGEFAGTLLLASPDTVKKTDFSHSPLNTHYLNSQLRNLISIEELRTAGSFFTCDGLSLKAVNFFKGEISSAELIFDPACGTGNLLLACTKSFEIKQGSLVATLTDWGRRLAGFDIHEEFIEATKIRLILEALQRGAIADSGNIDDLKNLFPNIRKHNSLGNDIIFNRSSHIIINPPYCKINLPESCTWGKGTGNSAALFMDRCLKYVNKGTEIVAILPDVLRSGSRYSNWRNFISENAEINLKTIGRFDAKTDVDVFLLWSKTGSHKRSNPVWVERHVSAKTIEDYFDVRAGHVVPHRHKEKGELFAYVTSHVLAGETDIHVDNIDTKRKFSGTVIIPPFIAVRRTSSPSDTVRAKATLIRGKDPVAVENHLLILKPKSGYVKDCRNLLKLLAEPETSDFLNRRIRCRHLTVAAIKEIPWREKEK